MADKVKDELLHDHNNDGIDRRGFLKCMAWAGTGALCVMQGGVLKSYSLSQISKIGGQATAGELSFVQISDSHMGFNKAANLDVVGTLKAAVDKINGLTCRRNSCCIPGTSRTFRSRRSSIPSIRLLKDATAKEVFFVPGEHDMLNDDGKQYLERYGKTRKAPAGTASTKKACILSGW